MTFGQIDILINNAGILRDASFAKMTTEQIDAVIDVHLKGAFYVTQPAFAAMKEAGYGRIVNTSSPSGIFGNFGQANYGAAKGGLVGMMNVLAIEGAKYNIKANAIAPVAKTRMTEDLLGPLADMVDPNQVMPLVVYLASEGCAVTHEVFSVGGGRYATSLRRCESGLVLRSRGGAELSRTSPPTSRRSRDISDYMIPQNNNEEMALLFKALQG